jgi:hypothetical protein
MPPAHIELFNELAAWILGEAYGVFPGHVYLKAAEFFPGATLEQRALFANTIDFLKREGFVIGHVVAVDGSMADATLTSRGLAILNRVPDSVAGKATLGERARTAGKSVVVTAVGDAAKEAARVALREVFAAIMAASTRP